MKTKPKKKNATIQQDVRHLGVVIEQVNDNVKLVAEQYGDVKKDIHGMKGDIQNMKETLVSHTEMIGSIRENMEIMKTDIQATKADMEIVKTDIEFIKHSFKKKVDIEEFAALERRVALLENRR
ncbi:hypothetical protein HY250_03395 [Candidatus Azambacteria bacterium]|nr:hypothetical protein [Candidatus Azambacteria bacterium]MBI3685422.1 hypothetical protein [Candidatus Azambacteria bacterium]